MAHRLAEEWEEKSEKTGSVLKHICSFDHLANFNNYLSVPLRTCSLYFCHLLAWMSQSDDFAFLGPPGTHFSLLYSNAPTHLSSSSLRAKTTEAPASTPMTQKGMGDGSSATSGAPIVTIWLMKLTMPNTLAT